MKVHRTLRQLCQLADATTDRQARHGMLAEIFQQTAREIPHVEHRVIGQTIEPLHDPFRRRTRAARNMGRVPCPRHIDPTMDRRDPRRTRERTHHACRTKDRQSALNP